MFGPGGNAASDIPDVGEAIFEEEGYGFGTATAEFAVHDDLFVLGDFVGAQREASKRDESGAFDAGRLKLVGLADIDKEVWGSGFAELVEVLDGECGDLRWGIHGIGGKRGHAAEAFVVDGFGDGRAGSADGAFGVAAEGEGAEAHGEGVHMQEFAEEGGADASEEFDGFQSLHGADHAGKNAENTAFGATGDEAGFGRHGRHAAITRASEVRGEHGDLAVETQNRAVNVGDFEPDSDVIAEVAGGEVVCSVND